MKEVKQENLSGYSKEGRHLNWEKVFRIKGSPGFSGSDAQALEDLEDTNPANSSQFYYEGIPKGKVVQKSNIVERIVLTFGKIALNLINSILLLMRLPFIGYFTVIEQQLTNIIETLIGTNDIIIGRNDIGTAMDSRRMLNIENILLDRVEPFKVDFFVTPSEAVNRLNGRTATGEDINEINERVQRAGESAISRTYNYSSSDAILDPGNNSTSNEITEEAYNKTAIGKLRAAYAVVYYLVFVTAFSFMFIAFLVAAIVGQLSSVGIRKSKNKRIYV